MFSSRTGATVQPVGHARNRRAPARRGTYGDRMAVIVVGAGIAGIACARELAAAGVPVRVLERARVVGGRMASPRLHGRPVDLGAAYFTARDPEFVELVERWRAAGLVREWTSELAVLGGDGGRSAGPVRYAAPGGLRSLVAALAEGVDVELEHEVRHVGPGPVVDGEQVDAVVLAMPDPQSARLLGTPSPAPEWTPVIAVATGWPERVWPELPAAFVNDHPVLTLVADDGDRRGDGAPVLVAHTTAGVAREHDAEPGGAVPLVVDALRELLGVGTPDWTHAHRWRFASPGRDRDEPFLLGADGIGFAGDGWGRPRVETAWRSGTLLARSLATGWQ
jgi:renalase